MPSHAVAISVLSTRLSAGHLLLLKTYPVITVTIASNHVSKFVWHRIRDNDISHLHSFFGCYDPLFCFHSSIHIILLQKLWVYPIKPPFNHHVPMVFLWFSYPIVDFSVQFQWRFPNMG